MFKKIALSLFLIFAGSLTAAAQELQYIGVQGSWWNPDFAGEGFAIEEYGDGYVIAYWYTYDSFGNQMWLIGTGQKQGNVVVLDMYRTEGGIMGDPAGSETLTEALWGNITLEVENCGHITMAYDGVDGVSGGYQLMRLRNNPLAAGSCNAIEIPEEPAPPETDPPEEEEPPEEPPAPTVEITMQKQIAGGQWVDVSVPFWGLAVIHKTVSGSAPRMDLFRLRIEAVDGEVVIESYSATEPTGISHPSIEGLWPGMRIPQGTEAVFTLESNTTGGERVYPYYSLFIQDYGQIVDLTVRLSTQEY
ncbi:MAG TPA: hypothetical protein VJ984_09745 [Xanthomonadales bacterium]|nr:hypothetical protein [Xanthomonadales bacterium]